MNFQTTVHYNTIIHVIHTDGATVVLSSLPNLRIIGWSSSRPSIFQIAATQFCSICKPCKLVEAFFMIINFHGYEGSKDHCQAIDEALTSDNFPSLRSVQLFQEIPFDYFPTLQSRNLLSVRHRL